MLEKALWSARSGCSRRTNPHRHGGRGHACRRHGDRRGPCNRALQRQSRIWLLPGVADHETPGRQLRGTRTPGSGHTLTIKQSPDPGRVHRVAPGDVGLCLTCPQPRKSFLPPMGRQLPRSVEPDAAVLRPLSALTRPGADQLAFELSQAAKHSQHQPGPRRLSPRLGAAGSRRPG